MNGEAVSDQTSRIDRLTLREFSNRHVQYDLNQMTSIIIHKQCQINDEWVKFYFLIHEFGMISNGWGVINIV